MLSNVSFDNGTEEPINDQWIYYGVLIESEFPMISQSIMDGLLKKKVLQQSIIIKLRNSRIIIHQLITTE